MPVNFENLSWLIESEFLINLIFSEKDIDMVSTCDLLLCPEYLNRTIFGFFGFYIEPEY